jgi:hypothetical protein
MYNQTIYNGLVNIIPFWSSNLIQAFGLGNEYNIVLNMIISELLKISTNLLNDSIWIGITILIGLFLIGYKLGFTLDFNLFDKNVVILIGKEIINSSETNIVYSDKILALNDYLVKKNQIKNITWINDAVITINPLSNHKLFENIFLDITRTYPNDNCKMVSYKIWSYSKDINKFLEKLVQDYKSMTNSEITLIGDETNNISVYPEPIHAINYYVNTKKEFPKLKCMNDGSFNLLSEQPEKSNGCNKEEKQSDTIDKINSNKNYSYTLDNITNYDLGKIFLSIYRENSKVYYNIKSEQINCKNWLENIVYEYNQNKNVKFKNKITLIGKEALWFDSNSYKKYYYSKEMWVINWLL